MRKYQQLFLLIISCLSVLILLVYKSENNRLKYVLQVVNFFGRSDVAVLRRLENNTKNDLPEFTKPLPVWQLIGDSFHAYTAYWNRNELVAGGEAHALVVGKKGAIINFHCNLMYDHGSKKIQGKFRFQRGANETLIDDQSIDFTTYNFFCRTNRDLGSYQPESVTFVDHASLAKGRTLHKLRLRYLKPTKPRTTHFGFTAAQATICVDLVTFNSSTNYAKNDDNILQFFLYHQAFGIEHFLIYNMDELPHKVIQILQQTNLRLHQLPFNFPFSYTNSSATTRVRQLLETDCLLRNLNQAHHTLLLKPNEFFYPKAKIGNNTLQFELKEYAKNLTRFEMTNYAVCIDDKHKMLIDNAQYDPKRKSTHQIYLYRLSALAPQLLTQTESVTLPATTAFVHHYINCQSPHDLIYWQNSIRADFMRQITSIRNEIDLLI